MILSIFVIFAAFLLFTNLGHYALWDDETMVSLAAEGILKTGDTTMLLDNNIVAYRSGLVLKNLADRSTPPLSSYITASSFSLFGKSAWAARLPFALMGISLMGFAAWIIGNSKLTQSEVTIWCIGILGNISLVLFLRQCRYYAPAIVLSVGIAYFYLRWKRESWNLVVIAMLSVLLFSANYMNCVALLVCLGLDFLIWKRVKDPLSAKQIVLFIGTLSAPCLLIASVWNPLTTKFGAYTEANSLGDRLTLFWWNLRDMNEAGFMIAGLIFLALYQAIFRKERWLARGLMMIISYVSVISLISPQIVKGAINADIRYLAPLIPFCLAIAITAYITILRSKPVLALFLALPVFWTNILNGSLILGKDFRTVPIEYFEELYSPVPEPYTPAATWIRDHVAKGESVWVLPDYMAYPLMFHASNAVYAWQLTPNQRKEDQFKDLSEIHFQGLVSPDYIIVFGPSIVQIRPMLENWKSMGVAYEEVYRINTFWKDLYRPELFWRTFKAWNAFNPDEEGVYIYRKSTHSKSS